MKFEHMHIAHGAKTRLVYVEIELKYYTGARIRESHGQAGTEVKGKKCQDENKTKCVTNQLKV